MLTVVGLWSSPVDFVDFHVKQVRGKDRKGKGFMGGCEEKELW